MKTTPDFNGAIAARLNELGIEHTIVSFTLPSEQFVTVDRTAMVRRFPADGDEHASYQATLEELRKICGNGAYVTWYGRTDDFLGIAVYYREPSTCGALIARNEKLLSVLPYKGSVEVEIPEDEDEDDE